MIAPETQPEQSSVCVKCVRYASLSVTIFDYNALGVGDMDEMFYLDNCYFV